MIGVRWAIGALLACLGLALALSPLRFRTSAHPPGQGNYMRVYSLAGALARYTLDHSGEYPRDLDALAAPEYPYVAERDLAARSGPNEQMGVAFHYVSGLKLNDPQDWILLYLAPDANFGKGVVLTLDGRVSMIDAEEFSRRLDAFTQAHRVARGVDPDIIAPH